MANAKPATTATKPKSEKPEKSKREKFVEIGNGRVSTAITKIGAVRKLANPGSYEFDRNDVDKAIKALRSAVDETEEAFLAALEGKKVAVSSFTF